MSGTSKYISKQHASKSLKKMSSFILSGYLTDVVLIAGERHILAHRLVLSAGSDYFAAMFRNDLKEASEKEIKMCDVDGNILQALIKYCYTGEIEFVGDTAEELLGTACLLQINEVVEACSTFLINQLHPSNCIGRKHLGDSLGCKQLLQASHNYIIEHFAEVMKYEEFLMLSVDELAELLASTDLNVPSEDDVFKGLMSWIHNDPLKRKAHIGRLLAFIKFPFLSPSFVFDHVSTDPLIRNLPEFGDIILQIFGCHLLPGRCSMLESQIKRPRNYSSGIFIFGGYDSSSKFISSVEEYNPAAQQWTKQLQGFFSSPICSGIMEFEGKVYVCGGTRQGITLNEVMCFDVKKKTSTTLPPMLTQRSCLEVGILNGLLYAVGGENQSSTLKSVETFNPATKIWSYVSSMSQKRQNFGLAVLDGKLYAVGGSSVGANRNGYNNYVSILSSVECYDPFTNQWNTCSSMMTARKAAGVGVLNGLLYVVGGVTDSNGSSTNSVERYDPKTNTWSLVAPMLWARECAGVCALGEKLFVIGGSRQSQCLNTVEAYNPCDNVWVQVSPLNQHRQKPVVIRGRYIS